MTRAEWSFVAGSGLLVDRGHQRVEDLAAPAALVERAGRLGRAVVEEAPELRLEALGLTRPETLEVQRRVDRTVEHHGPDVVGEEVRVDRADERPVREPEIRQLVVPDRHAQGVEVARDRIGREVRQRGVVPLGAFAGIRAGGRDERAELGRIVGRGIQRGLPVQVVDAPDGRARIHPARIEPDDVEALAKRRREELVAPSRTKSTPDPPGPPGIDEQRPDPARLVGRGQPDHRDVEGALRRRRVVAREADLRTQEAVPAIAPSCGAHGEAGRAGWAGRGTRGRVRRAWRDGHHGCRRGVG